MIEFKDSSLLGGKARQVVLKILEYASVSTPGVLRPILRPVYEEVTKLSLVRRLIWGSTSLDRCHRYWTNPIDAGNKPIEYLNIGMANSVFMLGFVKKHVGDDARILEIGCNAGRNLFVLHEAGFKNLTGIEINPEAVLLMREKFPDMVKEITIHNDTVENTIGGIPDNSFDIVFTMAVLEHIHEDSSWIFGEIARVTSNLVLTIEDEVAVSWRTFARNYKSVFEKVGLKQIDFNDCVTLPEWYGSYKLRVFVKCAQR